MQRFICVANVTRDPEVTETPNGVKVAKFGIAVARRFKKDEADFFNVVAWRGTAETCGKYLHKGSKACFVGSIETRTYEGSDGMKRTAIDFVIEEVQFLPSGEKQEQVQLTPVEEDEDLPF